MEFSLWEWNCWWTDRQTDFDRPAAISSWLNLSYCHPYKIFSLLFPKGCCLHWQWFSSCFHFTFTRKQLSRKRCMILSPHHRRTMSVPWPYYWNCFWAHSSPKSVSGPLATEWSVHPGKQCHLCAPSHKTSGDRHMAAVSFENGICIQLFDLAWEETKLLRCLVERSATARMAAVPLVPS